MNHKRENEWAAMTICGINVGLRSGGVLLLAAVMLCVADASYAMTMNLARSYRPEPANPRSQSLTFYSPVSADFLFGKDQPVFVVCQADRRMLRVAWSLRRNLVKTPMLEGKVWSRTDNSARMQIPATRLKPGFYELHVKVVLSEDRTASGVTAFGYRMREMSVPVHEPRGFEQFWRRARRENAASPLDLNIEKVKALRGEQIDQYNRNHASLPGRYDPNGIVHDAVEVYKVDFRSDASPTGRVFGWYTKPVGEGPFPAMLVLPGAGNSARPAPVEHARHGYATLDIQVHGEPVDQPPKAYPAPPRNRKTGVEDPEQLAAYGMFLNAMRGVDALLALEHVDPSRVVVVGGSQGGRLSLAVAGMDERVRAVVAALTHNAYRPYKNWAQRMNEAGEPGRNVFRPQVKSAPSKTQAKAYYDVVHFASRIECPVMFNAGLIDPVSPPTTVYATYRHVRGPKEFVPLPNLSHDWSPAFDRRAWRWLERVLSDQ